MLLSRGVVFRHAIWCNNDKLEEVPNGLGSLLRTPTTSVAFHSGHFLLFTSRAVLTWILTA